MKRSSPSFTFVEHIAHTTVDWGGTVCKELHQAIACVWGAAHRMTSQTESQSTQLLRCDHLWVWARAMPLALEVRFRRAHSLVSWSHDAHPSSPSSAAWRDLNSAKTPTGFTSWPSRYTTWGISNLASAAAAARPADRPSARLEKTQSDRSRSRGTTYKYTTKRYRTGLWPKLNHRIHSHTSRNKATP